MGKKDTVMDKKNSKAPKAEPSMHGVTITVLVESSTVRSHRKPDQIKKSSRTHGYDRRAQLLAYSRELRYAHSHKIELPIWNSRRKPKVSSYFSCSNITIEVLIFFNTSYICSNCHWIRSQDGHLLCRDFRFHSTICFVQQRGNGDMSELYQKKRLLRRQIAGRLRAVKEALLASV